MRISDWSSDVCSSDLNCNEGHFEICAGKRRYYASLAAQAAGKEDVTLPCIQIAANDDAEALEISMIENMLRQAPDAVTQWESYTRLVKEGRSVDDIDRKSTRLNSSH